MRSLSCITCFIFLLVVWASAQTELQKSVVSNGGGKTSAAEKVIHVSVGQSVVGRMGYEDFEAQLGFWNISIDTTVLVNLFTKIRENVINPSLSQNYPNPFNDETTFDLDLPYKENIVMTIYHMDGRFVRTLINGSLESGSYKISMMASEFLPGQYYCEFKAGDYTVTRKLIVVR